MSEKVFKCFAFLATWGKNDPGMCLENVFLLIISQGTVKMKCLNLVDPGVKRSASEGELC